MRGPLLLLALFGRLRRFRGRDGPGRGRDQSRPGPADARCLRAVVTGPTRAVNALLDAQPGAAASWTLSGLPTGKAVITADAYPVACGSLTASVGRSWFALPVVLTVVPAGTNLVTLKMYL